MIRRTWAAHLVLTVCALLAPTIARASGVPIGGFLPLVGISLTDEFKPGDDPSFLFADPEPSLVGTQLGLGGVPNYQLALLDSGAGSSLLTTAGDAAFNVGGAGFRGTLTTVLGGASGFLDAIINDPLAIFAAGLASRTSIVPLEIDTEALVGQSTVSLLTIPPESDLPNVLGLPFSSQYATHIRSDQPQIFELDGRTVRTPQIEFAALGSGGQGIVRRAPFELIPGAAFTSPPFYFPSFLDPFEPTEDPALATVTAGGMFLNVNVENDGQSLTNFQFLFDTGADVTVVSELNAVRLGFDPILDEPDFTVAVVGSAGVIEEVPGFFADEFTIQAIGGSLTLDNVPIIVLDVVDPGDPGNVVEGIVGTNLLAGRNVVIDPKPAVGGGGVGPSLYISDPVTSEKNWTSTAASGTFATGGNWSGGSAPGTLHVANVRHVSGGNQAAVVAADATVWELNVSGTVGQTMTVEISGGIRLTTFSGVNIEQGGVVELHDATLDAQYVEIVGGGHLRGAGLITTGSGPIPGQVEVRDGNVQVGDNVGNDVGTLEIEGRFAVGAGSTLEFDILGPAPGTQHDQIIVDGGVTLDGALVIDLDFDPDVGDSFTLIAATDGVSGSFEALAGGGVHNLQLLYDSESVQLVIGIPGDYNDDGTVSAADYTVWRNTLGQFGPSLTADGDGSGLVDQGDYAVWKANYGASAGTGAGAMANGVPEPGALALLLLAAAAATCGSARRVNSRVRCGASRCCGACGRR
jgi:hypothetical protein